MRGIELTIFATVVRVPASAAAGHGAGARQGSDPATGERSAMKRPRLFVSARAALCAALLLAGTGTGSGLALAADSPFEIDAILSLTGQNAFIGNQELQGFQALEEAVNKNGGIRGRPIKIVVADDQTNPQVSVQLANQIIAKGAAVILGLGISAACKAVLPLVEKNGPLTICFTPAFEPAPKSYAFLGTVRTVDTLAVVMRYFRERGWTRLALITTNDATGKNNDDLIDSVVALPENAGMRLVAQEHFNVTDLSVTAQLSRIKAAQPQALFSVATGTPFGTLLHAIEEVGLDIPVATSTSNMTYDQMGQYAAFLPRGLYFPAMIGMLRGSVGPGPVRDAQTFYFDALKARGLRPATGHNLVWDATMIVLSGFRQLGFNATAEQLHDYVEQLRGWNGINGTYNFPSYVQRGTGQSSVLVTRWDERRRDFVAVSKPDGDPT